MHRAVPHAGSSPLSDMMSPISPMSDSHFHYQNKYNDYTRYDENLLDNFCAYVRQRKLRLNVYVEPAVANKLSVKYNTFCGSRFSYQSDLTKAFLEAMDQFMQYAQLAGVTSKYFSSLALNLLCQLLLQVVNYWKNVEESKTMDYQPQRSYPVSKDFYGDSWSQGSSNTLSDVQKLPIAPIFGGYVDSTIKGPVEFLLNFDETEAELQTRFSKIFELNNHYKPMVNPDGSITHVCNICQGKPRNGTTRQIAQYNGDKGSWINRAKQHTFKYHVMRAISDARNSENFQRTPRSIQSSTNLRGQQSPYSSRKPLQRQASLQVMSPTSGSYANSHTPIYGQQLPIDMNSGYPQTSRPDHRYPPLHQYPMPSGITHPHAYASPLTSTVSSPQYHYT